MRWTWTAPPGTTITGTGPVVNLTITAGVYGSLMVGLEVEDSNGCITNDSVTIVVYEPPTARLAVPASVCTDEGSSFDIPLDATATTPGTGLITGYSWTTDQGSVSGSGSASETLTLPAGFTGSDQTARLQD